MIISGEKIHDKMNGDDKKPEAVKKSEDKKIISKIRNRKKRPDECDECEASEKKMKLSFS